ncbi:MULTISPECIES: hypothetical protein [Streptomyces]|uniref:Uncharacterized protein n=1 Tax=Streptomyces flaveolus TaxID=67297 RepID=A0ABV1VBR5_9ACTN
MTTNSLLGVEDAPGFPEQVLHVFCVVDQWLPWRPFAWMAV